MVQSLSRCYGTWIQMPFFFFAPESQAHGQILRMQTEQRTPIIQWAEKAFQGSLDILGRGK